MQRYLAEATVKRGGMPKIRLDTNVKRGECPNIKCTIM